MGNSPSHQAGGQEAGQKCADNQAGSSTNRVHGGTRKTKITVHGVPVDISEDCVCGGPFFAKYGQVEDVTAVTSKSSIATVMYS